MPPNGADQPLITRYRPQRFTDMWGNPEAIAALSRRLEDGGRPHAYLFTGNSGVGKTTLARIVGNILQADKIEVDAASNNGVDAMRALVETGYYLSPGAACRMIILDEAHRLTRNAFDIMLKILEEPPAHLYFALCTTELARIPSTIVSRCYHVSLKPLGGREIEEFLLDIMDREGWMETVDPDVFHLIIREANGSPRLALSLLQEVYDAPSLEEATRIVAIHGSDSPLTQLLTQVIAGRDWSVLRPMLAQLADDDFTEASLIQASRYAIAALQRAESEDRAKRLWELVAAMTYPAHSFDPKSVFVAAIGRFLWGSL